MKSLLDQQNSINIQNINNIPSNLSNLNNFNPSNNNIRLSNNSNSNNNQDDIMNYQSLINKLTKGSIAQKSTAIKKMLFLYQNSRARIYLYERRIVESLELCLLIQQKQVSLSALTLLEKIMTNASAESQITQIFKKKMLSKVILNLGSVDINVRKISHKCIHEFVRKFKDYEPVVTNYLKTALKPQNQQPQTTKHLKLKSINSLHSLIMAESKYFKPDQQYALQLIQELIASSYQKQFQQIRRASLICLIFVLKINGSENALKQISMKTQNQLYQLRMESEELAALLEMIMKYSKNNTLQSQVEQQGSQECYSSQNAPSPKFISIQQSEVLIQKPPVISNNVIIQQKPSLGMPSNFSQSLQQMDQPQPHQLKIYSEVSYAQQFLKKLQKFTFTSFTAESLEQIKSFAPFLQKYLVDQSIKLFSISKKIVQVIFDSIEEAGEQSNKLKIQKQIQNYQNNKKEVYVIVVPCVVKGIGNKRFIVRKNLDKLVRTYAKNHPQVWINNFLDRFAKTQNVKIKELLIDLFSFAYKTSPQFYYPVEKPFQIFDVQIANKNSSLKWKVIDCVILMLERQGKQTQLEQLLQKFSVDSYNKILRKLNKNTMTIQITTNNGEQKVQQLPPSQQFDIDVPSPVSAYKRKYRRGNRLITDVGEQKMLSIQKDEDNTDRMSEQKKISLNKGLFFKQKRNNRKSYVDYDIKNRRKTQKRSLQSKQRNSLQKLPELRIKNPKDRDSHSLTKNQIISSISPESPVKKSFTQKNIMYIERQELQSYQDPKMQLQRALQTIKNPNSTWMSQFDRVNKIRAIVQNHSNIITQDYLQSIVSDLISCLNGNLRSGVMKISLICLDELLLKLKKRLYPYTETIIHTILKKSVSISEFMVDQLKKCICICTEQLCTSKIISYINGLLKQSKNTQIKLNILLIIQTMIRVQKVYKKQTQWIWMTLIQIHDQPQFQLRTQCKNIVKLILELYKQTWKNDVSYFKKYNLQKIDKILKNLNQKGQNSWIQQQNLQFQKILFSKGINSKYFSTQYAKFQQNDKLYYNKKNWKDRIKLINDTFGLAFEYTDEFESNSNIRKYMNILCEHLDEKNPGMLVNAVNLLIKCTDIFNSNSIIEQILQTIFQKYILIIESKRSQLISIYQKLISKIYQKYDLNKILRQFIKIILNNSLKIKSQAINQICFLLKQQQNANKKQDKLYSISINNSNSHNSNSSNSTSLTHIDKDKQKVKNKQNSLKDIMVIQTPNLQTNNIKVNYNIGSQTPNNASSSVNIQNACYLVGSQNSINVNGSHSLQRQKQRQKRKINQLSVNMIIKMINKLNSDKTYESSNILNNKLKDLVGLCNKKFGSQFNGKLNNSNGNQRLEYAD